MKACSPDSMRALDARTIESGIPGAVLMERAGRGVAQYAARLLAETNGARTVWLFAGPGNNGGDIYAAARFLKEAGFSPRVFLAVEPNRIQGDARHHFEKLGQAGVVAESLMNIDSFQPVDLIVDGLLGTGTSGAPRGLVLEAARQINVLSQKTQILAVDIPSGLDGCSGEPQGETVRADLTLTIGLPKVGLLSESARDYTGSVEVLDIGFPQEFVTECPAEGTFEMIAPADLVPLFAKRRRDSHKGSYGRVLLLGGAVGYSGAMTMAARSAVRSGAGLVYAVTPLPLAAALGIACPEAMVRPADATKRGSLQARSALEAAGALDQYDAILVGPGLTRDDESDDLVKVLISEYTGRLLLDADAVALCKGRHHLLRSSSADIVLTPHPGELAELLACEIPEIQRDRPSALNRGVAETGATLVLKGSGTLIGNPEGQRCINLNGNPGLAKGGSGDVLAGLITGLLAQGLTAYNAARAGVWLHGCAADHAARLFSEYAMTPGDVMQQLPAAFRQVAER